MWPLAITGMGVISAFGVGTEPFFDGIVRGRAPFRERRPTGLPGAYGALIDEFDMTPYIGHKGIRTLSRETKLLLTAAALIREAAWPDTSSSERSTTGVAVATTAAGLEPYVEFYRGALEYGEDRVDPALGPQTGFNAPAAQLSIWFGLQGPNLTLAGGTTSGLAAVDQSAMLIDAGRATLMIAGGLETVGSAFTDGARACLGARETREPRPYDSRRAGAVLGEAALALVCESVPHAVQRGAAILARVIGYGAAFEPGDSVESLRLAAVRAVRLAIADAQIRPDDVDCVFSSADGHGVLDAAEAHALGELFGNRIWVCSVKGATGECLGASAVVQIAACVSAIGRRVIPPTVGYQIRDRSLPPLRIASEPVACAIRTAVVTALDLSGMAAAAVLCA